MKQCPEPEHEWAPTALQFEYTKTDFIVPSVATRTIVIEVEVCVRCSKVRNAK